MKPSLSKHTQFKNKLEQWRDEIFDSGYETAFWKEGMKHKPDGLVNGNRQDEFDYRIWSFILSLLEEQRKEIEREIKGMFWQTKSGMRTENGVGGSKKACLNDILDLLKKQTK
jgi:hypothetical protein